MSKNPLASPPATGPLFAGVDVGGTNIKVGIVDDTGRRLAFESLPTEPDKPSEVAMERAGRSVRKMIELLDVPHERVVRLGLATPGPMDVDAGVLLEPGNLLGHHVQEAAGLG